jgi:hypothetical protein
MTYSLLSPTTDTPPWCEIRLGERVTRYRRLGTGRSPVVLLSTAPVAEPLWPEALEAVAAHHRIYAPEIPSNIAGFGPWLRGFMDGVGAERPAIVATASLCIPALEYALLDPYRIRGLVLIPDGVVDETGLDGTISSANGSATLPILVLRREHPAGSAVELLMRFLRQPVLR